MTIGSDMCSEADGYKDRQMADDEEGAPEDRRSNRIVIGQMPCFGSGDLHKMIHEEEVLQFFFRILPVRRKIKVVVDQGRTYVRIEPDAVTVDMSLEEEEAQNEHQKKRFLIVRARAPQAQNEVHLHRPAP